METRNLHVMRCLCVLHGHGTEKSTHHAFKSCLAMHITDSFFEGEDENALGRVHYRELHCIGVSGSMQLQLNAAQIFH